MPGLRLSGIALESRVAKFDLQLTVSESVEGLRGEVSYALDLYEVGTVERMGEHLGMVLWQMVAESEQKIGDWSLLREAEREQVVVGWNRTAAEYPRGCVHELFEEQVRRTPEAAAVEYEGRQLSYAELNRRANQLGHYLRKQGVGPEVKVAICMERSLEMVVAIVGVLKAGGVYVPVDPEYPAARLGWMLEDSRVPVILTQKGLAAAMPGQGAQVVLLDTEWEEIAEETTEDLGEGSGPENAAYLIYTSGSTGRPKGVVITHAALANHMAWMQREFAVKAGERVLQKTAFGFDASVWEFYAPLLSGGCLVMARPGGQRDPQYLVSCIREQQITVLQLVPTQLRMLLQHGGLRECGGLRRIYCGGEALTVEAVLELYSQLPGTRLYNLYGPTEATIDVTFAECHVGLRSMTAPIGRPIANMQAYVVDQQMELVPVGVAGELYVGGDGLARGYQNQSDLTGERFVPNPFHELGGERLYRTGDRVRWQQDGQLEFLGRLDQQVKVRGYRIELGEIEARLLEHAGVQEAVVMAREDASREKHLVAYYTCAERSGQPAGEGKEAVGAEQLRAQLLARLPGYMVPSAYVRLERLPLTANGKLDRKALPAPGGDAYLRHQYEAPRGEVESTIAAIWAEELKVGRVGRHDNFFELGGHSLLAVRVIERMRRSGLKVDVRALFVTASLADLANSTEELMEVIL